eukprot:m.21989 g.21989  ORF g.21989 m.21989 type:complete len:276 (-) comp5406_c0_seq2:950-1777(-)
MSLKGCPITQYLLVGTVAFSITSALAGPLPWPSLYSWFGTLGSIFRFTSTQALLGGAACIFNCRNVERYLGQSKFLLGLMSIYVTSVGLNFFLGLSSDLSSGVFSFALAFIYLRLSPPAKTFELLGIRFRPRVWMLVSLFMLWRASPHGSKDALLGFVASFVWMAFLSKMDISESISSKFKVLADLLAPRTDPLLDLSKTRQNQRRQRQTSGRGARYEEQLLGGDGRAMHQRPPTEENILSLVRMGYTRELATYALRQAGNNIEGAIDILMQNSA